MQNTDRENVYSLVNQLVRYRPELMNPAFLQEHGTVAVDCIFKVIGVKQVDGETIVKAEVPGTPFVRDINPSLLQLA